MEQYVTIHLVVCDRIPKLSPLISSTMVNIFLYIPYTLFGACYGTLWCLLVQISLPLFASQTYTLFSPCHIIYK